RRIRAADELQRLALERRESARTQLVGLAKYFPGIVTGRVGARRRGAELDGRIEHRIEQRRGRDRQPGPRQRAELIVREEHDRAALLGGGERLRMLHVGGGEDLRRGAADDLVLERSRGAELRLHLDAGCGLECRASFGERGAQTAGGVELHRVGRERRTGHRYDGDCRRQDTGHLMPPAYWRWGRTAAGRRSYRPQSLSGLRPKRASR